MLGTQNLHAAEANHQNSAVLFNEVILDGASIAADPAHAVAAFVYQEQNLRPWENHGVNPSLATATSARGAFLARYPQRRPEDVPLLRLDLDAWDAPFSEG